MDTNTSSKLYIVPTPIGNFKDITYRALEIFQHADFILAEDTRKTHHLLKHFNIENSLQPYHTFNEHQQVPGLIEVLKKGKTIALCSNAGTPGISDPGFLIVRECIKENILVETLPGATAFVPALVVSGLPCERFCFEGFLPHKKGRTKRLKELTTEKRTMVFYESPHRIIKTLQQFIEYFGNDRQVGISREITKIHEETQRGTLQELCNIFELRNKNKGEFVLIVEGNKGS